MKLYLLVLVMFITANCCAQEAKFMQERPVTFKNPKALSLPKGYSQAAEIDMGNSRMIIMAGQVALDKAGNLVGKGDLTKQAN